MRTRGRGPIRSLPAVWLALSCTLWPACRSGGPRGSSAGPGAAPDAGAAAAAPDAAAPIDKPGAGDAAGPASPAGEAAADAADAGDGTRVVRIAAKGGDHTCALRADGAVFCWGDNASGALGDGTTVARGTPVRVRDLPPAVGIAAGSGSSCALHADGSVSCWGHVAGRRTVPVRIDGLPPAAAVAVGGCHACALLRDRSVSCWACRFEAPAAGGGPPQSGSHTTPAPVAGLEEMIDISLETDRGCGLREDGAVLCWRLLFADDAVAAEPERLPAPPGAARLALGGSVLCLLDPAGQVRCWCPGCGQLPLPVPGVRRALDACAAGHNACLVDENGTVACRGKGDDGQTADVERRDWVEHPVRIRGLDRARQVVVGRRHACALLEDDSVRCWGNDLRGQLGKGTGPGARGPVTVPGLANVAHVSAGFETACAVLADGTVRCWGSNAQGQIGDGTRVDRPTPTPVAGLTEATYVSIGSPRTCARRTDGTVWCWGDAQFVPPGDGGRSAASLPAPLPDLTGVAEIEMGSGGCARLDDGTLRCWGDCHERKPGSPRLTGVAEVAVGANVRCARRTDGSVHCWACDCEMATCGGEGTPYGPRRVATFLARRSPFARAPGVSSSLARQLSIDEGFGCALLVGGVAACWRNDLGSMPPQGMVTTDLLEVAGADLVAAGESLNCVRMAADGSVQCWGELRGDYGPGPVARDRLTPIDDLRGAAQLAAGEGFACARMPDGTVRCFGAWSRGQLGDGALGYSAVPVAVVW